MPKTLSKANVQRCVFDASHIRSHFVSHTLAYPFANICTYTFPFENAHVTFAHTQPYTSTHKSAQQSAYFSV